jgi:hypothetical protein
MNDIVINSIDDLTSFNRSNDADELIYRGQSSADWGLVPTIYRGLEAVAVDDVFDELVRMERDLYREFQNKSAGLLEERVVTAWDVLVSAQHYGSPTRLLDWTTKLFGAAYFAVAGSPDDDGVVWVAKPGNLPVPSELGRLHFQRSLRIEQVRRYVPDSKLPFMMPVSLPVPTFGEPENASTDQVIAFDQSGTPDHEGLLIFLEAPFTNPRIRAQGGLFSVYVSRTEEIVLDHAEYLRLVERKTGTTVLRRLIVPAVSKRKMIRDLERLGIDALALFPDVDGLSAYLRGRHRDGVDAIYALL